VGFGVGDIVGLEVVGVPVGGVVRICVGISVGDFEGLVVGIGLVG